MPFERYKYFDLVPRGSSREISPDDFRRALRQAGLVPTDSDGLQWRESADSSPEAGKVFIVTNCGLVPFYTNTQTLRIYCPKCGSEVSRAKWHDAVEGLIHGNRDSEFELPCCGAHVDIRKLTYDPPVYSTSAALSVLCDGSSSHAPVKLRRTLEEFIGEQFDCLERLC
ncbi:MAG: hypothetical protein U5N86_04060 [Planctomycetota bacterium]|nr:hypothetical protein [Planctomycetota bacterium]